MEQFTELSGEHECLRIDIDCIERQIETLEMTMCILGEYIGLAENGQEIHGGEDAEASRGIREEAGVAREVPREARDAQLDLCGWPVLMHFCAL